MFPINVRRGKPDYLQPRNDNLKSITIESDGLGWPMPAEPGDFTELLNHLPTGFSKQFQYGLGLKWEYRSIVNSINSIPGVTELVISNSAETVVTPPTYRLGVKRFEQLRRAIDTITRRYQREALEDKLLLTYGNLLRAVLPSDYPLRTKKIRPGAIYELVKIGGERSNLSRSDHQAAMSIITKNKEEIAKTDSQSMLALRSEIEKVSLGVLIQKFEDMLGKNLTEPQW